MREVLLSALRSVLPSEPGTVVVHSSFSHLMPPAEFSRWDALYAIDTLCREGWTILLPAFTFSFCGGANFSSYQTQSEVGPLADWALKHLPDAVRTSHPIYSFAVVGSKRELFALSSQETTFGPGTPFELFETLNATVVMLGCTWAYCTPFHRYEELAAVPYRYYKTFDGQADFGAGEAPATARMFVRDLTIDARNDFSSVVKDLRQRSAIRTATLWRGKIEAASAGTIAATCLRLLAHDPLAFVDRPTEVKYRISKRNQRNANPTLRVAVLGSSNVEQIHRLLPARMAELDAGRQMDLHSVPYGQLQQQIIDQQSELSAFAPEITVFLDRAEDLAGVRAIDEVEPATIKRSVERYAAMIRQHHERHKSWTIVSRFANFSCGAGLQSSETNAIIAELNATLELALAGTTQLAWIDPAAVAAHTAAPAFDDRLWHIGRFPYSEPFARQVTEAIVGLILSITGRTARLLVLDLDNTLWGGVVGEDGKDGIAVGGDFPGNAYSSFQRVLKRLSHQGFALAIASKNDEDLARDAIETVPSMVLRMEHIVAHRINWEPKWVNVRQICEELSLGLESVLFIDDNPVEREAIRRNLPGVKILDLPEDPTLYAKVLGTSPWVQMAQITNEDRKRASSYKARAQLEAERASAESLDDFLRSLGIRLHLKPLGEGNIARATQLSQKTNQFNTTTRRYDRAALEKIADDGGDVAVIGAEDNFSDFENIGLIVLREHDERANWGVVDSYLLSCRILGRGIEKTIALWAVQRARARGWHGLTGKVVETERNTPARGVFKDAGYALVDGEWESSGSNDVVLPDWIELSDELPNPISDVADSQYQIPRNLS